MAELGGPTTQSGILYQNTIAAIYLGRLCQPGIYPSHEQIIEVRCEAPTIVDDIVVTFEDGHHEFVQAKEAVELKGASWGDIWQDFAQQFTHSLFQPAQDKLVLFVGEPRNEWRGLRGMAERAEGSLCFAEWNARLSQTQKQLFMKIQTILSSAGLDVEDQRSLLSCVRVNQEAREDLELRAYREMPFSNVRPMTLFRLLRDRAGQYARLRKPFYHEGLLKSLHSEDGITFDSTSTSTMPNAQSFVTFVPEDRSRIQWFVSSRLKNGCLREEREAAIGAIMATQIVVPWAWERNVPAGNHPYKESCLHFAARSDGLVLIIEGGISPFCRQEYDAAASAKKPCHIFIKDGKPINRITKQFLDEQRQFGSNPVRFRSSTELESLLGESLKLECVRGFRRSQHLILSVQPAQARIR